MQHHVYVVPQQECTSEAERIGDSADGVDAPRREKQAHSAADLTLHVNAV